MIDIIYDCYRDLKKENIFFFYNGIFPHEVITEIAEMIFNKTKMEDVKAITRNRLFSVIVEQMQNMNYYSDKHLNNSDSSVGEGTIMVGYEGNYYFVICANMIEAEKIVPLREKINKLKSMSKQQLKEYYNYRRKQKSEIDSKGASLGLIEIARRSSKPLEFCFKEVDNELSFFLLKTII